ncbi:MAG: hypothetical protein RR469_05815 [Erysipelotrichaceae bacterium]
MTKIIFTLWKIDFSQNVNRWIFYIRKIPFIGKLLSSKAYGTIKTKRFFSIVAFIVSLLFSFLKKIVFVALLCVPAFMIYPHQSLIEHRNLFLHMFIVFSLLMGSMLCYNANIGNKKAYLAIQLFKVKARTYELANQVMVYTEKVVFLFLPYLVMGYFFRVDHPMFFAFRLCFYFLTAHLIRECIDMWLFKHYPNHRMKLVPQVILSLIFLGLAILPFGLHLSYDSYALLMNPITLMLFLVGFIFALVAQRNFTLYTEIFKEGFIKNQASYDYESLMSASRFADVKLKDHMDTTLSSRITKLKGYEYINKIFFIRHKTMLQRPIKIRLLCTLIVLTAIFIALYFLPEYKIHWNDALLAFIPLSVYLMYAINVSSRMVKAMFYNCDKALLHYSFYRKKEVLLKNFIVRLKVLCAYNLLVALFIIFGLYMIQSVLRIDYNVTYFLALASVILLQSIFFSVHHLCMYYIFQPFTESLGLKNPFYKFINGFIYMLCFACLYLEGMGIMFALVVLISTILYIIIALYCVYHFSPKTFRIKT